jgi:hypothetical protein
MRQLIRRAYEILSYAAYALGHRDNRRPPGRP